MANYNFENLVEVNKTLKTTDIKGKQYAEVNQRIKAFRMLCPMGCIQTELISDDGERCVFKATIIDDEGKVLGTGTAFELKGNSFINKTSYIENCETSAVGRALAMCGIGIDVSVASYEEVANAMENQGKAVSKDELVKDAEQLSRLLKYINSKNEPEKVTEFILSKFDGVKKVTDLSKEQIESMIKFFEMKGETI